MGALRLRDVDLQRARDDRALDPHISRLRTGAEMLVYYRAEAKRQGIKLLPKSSLFGPRWQALFTTFPRTIRLGKSWEKLSVEEKGLVLSHEFTHVHQWDLYRNFGVRYLGPRFGWSMEMQAYRGEVRARYALGHRDEEIRAWVKTLPNRIWESYLLLRQIRWANFKQHSLAVLRSEFCP